MINLKKFSLFYLKNNFQSSCLGTDILTVEAQRTDRAFRMSGATQAVVIYTSKAFHRVYQAGLIPKHKYSKISGHVF